MPRATFCYVILAHRYSGIVRLVRRVASSSPDARIVVRFEDTTQFDVDELRAAGAIPLVSTIRARWGDWTLTDAMLEALGVARAVTDADYYVLVSGQDYPVRDLAAWEEQVAQRAPDAILDPIVDHPRDWRSRWAMVPMPWPRHEGAYRALRHAAWRVGTVTDPALTVLPRFVDGDRRWLIGVARPRARVPHGVRVTKCSQWMTLSARAVAAVLERDGADRALRDFFRTVRVSDESYVQSMLHADPGLRIEHGQTTLKRFPPGKASPQLLDVATLRELADGSEAPFARKVAPDGDDVRDAADALAAAERHAREGSTRLSAPERARTQGRPCR